MSSPASLDVRLPIGAMFAADGVILTVHGLMTPPPPAVAELAGNINLWWGLVLVVFGGTMLGLARRAKKAKAAGS